MLWEVDIRRSHIRATATTRSPPTGLGINTRLLEYWYSPRCRDGVYARTYRHTS